MKLVRFRTAGHAAYGILHENEIQPVTGPPYKSIKPVGKRVNLSEVTLLAPCRPSKIIAIGINYRSHALEFKHDLPETPLMFLKPASAVIGTGAAIVYPPSAGQVDYEGEVGVVIKKRGRFIEEKSAGDYILGYTCFNDVTARDLQRKDGQWTRGKGFDTFACIGPCIETECDPGDIRLQTFHNGVLKQQASTSDLIFPIHRLVSFVSEVMTLLPGDVIACGTPSGVGAVAVGDVIEIRIQGIGSLINPVSA